MRMKPVTIAWREYAQRDYEDGEALLSIKRYHGALFFYHQSLEKLAKVYIIEHSEHNPPFVHDIRYLLKLTQLPVEDIVHVDLKELSLVYTRLRYPDMNTSHYSDTQVVLNLIKQFKTVYLWLHTQFKDK